ncbi:hypothetical protein BRN20_00250, partial [Xanthomonas oryzae pv. oryzae]
MEIWDWGFVRAEARGRKLDDASWPAFTNPQSPIPNPQSPIPTAQSRLNHRSNFVDRMIDV